MVKHIIKKIILLNMVFCFLMTAYRIIFVIYYGQLDALKSNPNYLVKLFL
jgi:hypothetical protein